MHRRNYQCLLGVKNVCLFNSPPEGGIWLLFFFFFFFSPSVPLLVFNVSAYLLCLDSKVHTQNLMKMRWRTADHPSTSVTWRMMMKRRRFNVLAGMKGRGLAVCLHLLPLAVPDLPPPAWSDYSQCLIGSVTTVLSLSQGFHNMQIILQSLWELFGSCYDLNFYFFSCIRLLSTLKLYSVKNLVNRWLPWVL